jgi:hypothetical protein
MVSVACYVYTGLRGLGQGVAGITMKGTAGRQIFKADAFSKVEKLDNKNPCSLYQTLFVLKV